MTDRIVIFYGSKKDFEELVATETSKEQVTIPFMELIQHYNARLRPNESGVRESALSRNIDVDNCVVMSRGELRIRERKTPQTESAGSFHVILFLHPLE